MDEALLVNQKPILTGDSPMLSTTAVRIIAGVLFVVVAVVIIARRKRKSA